MNQNADQGYHTPTPEELGIVSDSARLAGFLPYLREEIARMVTVLENRVFTDIQSGKLTPELAQAAWLERYSYHRLLSRFDQKVRVGAAIGKRTNLDF